MTSLHQIAARIGRLEADCSALTVAAECQRLSALERAYADYRAAGGDACDAIVTAAIDRAHLAVETARRFGEY